MKARSVLMALVVVTALGLAVVIAGPAPDTAGPAKTLENITAAPGPAPASPEAASLEADPFYGAGDLETVAKTCERCRILAGRSCPGRPTGFACNDNGCVCMHCKGSFDCYRP
ncbi:MAG: hypothetical protein ACRD6R_10410 [Candidatus Polarisedimenticolia bacterium]